MAFPGETGGGGDRPGFCIALRRSPALPDLPPAPLPAAFVFPRAGEGMLGAVGTVQPITSSERAFSLFFKFYFSSFSPFLSSLFPSSPQPGGSVVQELQLHSQQSIKQDGGFQPPALFFIPMELKRQSWLC